MQKKKHSRRLFEENMQCFYSMESWILGEFRTESTLLICNALNADSSARNSRELFYYWIGMRFIHGMGDVTSVYSHLTLLPGIFSHKIIALWYEGLRDSSISCSPLWSSKSFYNHTVFFSTFLPLLFIQCDTSRDETVPNDPITFNLMRCPDIFRPKWNELSVSIDANKKNFEKKKKKISPLGWITWKASGQYQ